MDFVASAPEASFDTNDDQKCQMGVNDKSGILSPTVGSRVEIVSIPCHFHASKYDLLEQLFLPLLCAAQQANDLMGVRVRGDRSALEAAAYMAGELLRDRSFAPVRSLSTGASNLYLLDFVADTFQVESTVFSCGTTRQALFRVRINGRVRGDKFQVFDPVTNNLLFSFSRVEADKPDFFGREFPLLAHESRKDLTSSGDRRNVPAHEIIDLMLGVPISGTTITVRVQKAAADSSVEVKSPTNGATVMRLPLSSLNNITKVAESIGQYLSTNASARQLLEGAAASSEREEAAPVPEKGEASTSRL
jgi:hypothetical protein